MRKITKVSVSLPEQLLDQVDRIAEDWLTNRSAAIARIIQEWKQLQAKQLPLAVADETPQDNPTEQMKRAGCGRLVDA